LVREQIIIVKAGKLVPFVIDAVDDRLVRAGQPTAELQVVWRVRKHEIDRLVGNPRQKFNTVTLRDRVFLDGHSGAPLNLRYGKCLGRAGYYAFKETLTKGYRADLVLTHRCSQSRNLLALERPNRS
jgi:hypothetical protein